MELTLPGEIACLNLLLRGLSKYQVRNVARIVKTPTPTPTPIPIFSPVVSPEPTGSLSPGSDVFVGEDKLVFVVAGGVVDGGSARLEVETVDPVSEPGGVEEVGACLAVDDDDDEDDTVDSRLSSSKLRVPAGKPYVQVKNDLVAGVESRTVTLIGTQEEDVTAFGPLLFSCSDVSKSFMCCTI